MVLQVINGYTAIFSTNKKMPMLEVIDLNFDYIDRPLLHGIEFSLNKGCLLHLRGANGSGKTTLLKLLAGLLQPDQGDIRYLGHSITDDLAAYQHDICYVGHKSGISQLLTIRENFCFELCNTRCQLSFTELMQIFSLQGLEDMPCGLLSAGQRRRVGLLRLLMSDASLWLLDEPLVALDKDAICILMTCLTDHLAQGGQVILTSHQRLPLNDGDYQEYHL